jgi:glycosyltransferase involved in cell wall biosynthesis
LVKLKNENGLKLSKKVIRIITRLNVGGPSKHVSWLSDGLNNKGWKNIVVSGKVEADENDMSGYFDTYSIEYIESNNLKRSISLKYDFKSIVELYQLLKQEQPQIVHTHMSKAALVGRVAVMFYNLLNKHKIKTVHTFHGHTFHGYFSPMKEKLFLNIERFLAKFATNKIITISKQQQDEILNRFDVGVKKQHIQINLGIDTSFTKNLDRDSFRQDFNIHSDIKVFGIVGRIADIKNHKLFIDSVEYFNIKYKKDNVYFVIIGDGEKIFVDNLKEYASDIKNIIFSGNQTDPAYFYGALDYLVLTSKNEGTPVSILESFAAEIPVISTPAGGVVDIIGKNERGYLVEADKEKLAKTYSNILISDSKDKIVKAKEFVESNYSIESLVNNIDTLYKNLLEIKNG